MRCSLCCSFSVVAIFEAPVKIVSSLKVARTVKNKLAYTKSKFNVERHVTSIICIHRSRVFVLQVVTPTSVYMSAHFLSRKHAPFSGTGGSLYSHPSPFDGLIEVTVLIFLSMKLSICSATTPACSVCV